MNNASKGPLQSVTGPKHVPTNVLMTSPRKTQMSLVLTHWAQDGQERWSNGLHHLLSGVNGHGNVQEGLVEEWHAGLQAKCKWCLVGAHNIPLVQPVHLPHRFPAPGPIAILSMSGVAKYRECRRQYLLALCCCILILFIYCGITSANPACWAPQGEKHVPLGNVRSWK